MAGWLPDPSWRHTDPHRDIPTTGPASTPVLTNLDVAERLVISPHTVEKHVERLLATTGSRNRTQLATWRAPET